MLKKILIFIILGAIVGFCPADAQTSPAPASAPARVKGRIIAARVVGRADATSKATGVTRTLHDGDLVSEQTQIVTAPGASVILVFSNGATVNVAGDSNLSVDQFDQDPFATDLKVSELKQEPGTSTTKLSLSKGELVGKVVHLNVDKGSEFTVQTPVGAAGIRGTTFQIIFTPGPNGSAFFQVTTADGRVLFTGTTVTPVNIPAGKQVVVTFDVNSGTATTPVVVSGASTANLTQIQVASQAIAVAVANTTIPSNTGGASGGTGSSGSTGSTGGTGSTTPSNTPSQTLQPASTLSPLTGTG